MMPQVLRVAGAIRALLALVGLGFLFKGAADGGTRLPVSVLVLQILLIGTALAGGIGWMLLRDWGRKVLLIPSLFSVVQTASIVSMGLVAPGPVLWPMLLSCVVGSATLVLIFLPAARCEQPSWNAETNAAAFRVVGAFEVLVGLGLGALLFTISKSAEGLAVSVFTFPTVVLALIGGGLMSAFKNAGRSLLLVLWGVHAGLAGLGPALGKISGLGDFWQIALTASVSSVIGDYSSLATANLVFLASSLLLVLAWLPSVEMQKA